MTVFPGRCLRHTRGAMWASPPTMRAFAVSPQGKMPSSARGADGTGVSVFSARSGVAPANSLDYIFSGKEPLQWTTKSPSVTIPRRTGTMSVLWRGGGPPSGETPPALSCFPPPRAFFFSTPRRATLTFCCWTLKWAAWMESPWPKSCAGTTTPCRSSSSPATLTTLPKDTRWRPCTIS